MQQMTKENKKQLINIINQHSKQKDKRITEQTYNLLFIDQVKDLYNKYKLSQFQLKDKKEQNDISFTFVFYGIQKTFSSRYYYSSYEQVVMQFNNIFLKLGKYTLGQSVSRKDRLSSVFSKLYLKQNSQIYEEEKKKYDDYLEKKRKEEEQYKKKQEEKKLKQFKKQQKRDQRKQYSKKASKIIKYARPSKFSIYSIDNKSYSFENPEHFLQIGVVYGIVIENQIVYIGSSTILSERINQHKKCVQNKDIQNFQQQWLYKQMREKGYQFVILFKGENTVNREQLENIQFGYIAKYHPKYNYKGVKNKYMWSDKKEELNKVSWDDWIAYK